MKINNSKLYIFKNIYNLAIIVGVLILSNVDSLNFFKEVTDGSSSISTEDKLKKHINIDIHISSNKEVKVNGKTVKLTEVKKLIAETTNKYSTQLVSGFTYNVYAEGSLNQGFITDLFEIIKATQNHKFSIRRVLHPYE